MIKRKKILVAEAIPGFDESIENMPAEDKIFVDKSMEVAHFILQVMQDKGIRQKELADRMGKTEAEVSKWLTGMHNFTLRSLAKIEAALATSVLTVPELPLVAAPPITKRTILHEKREVLEKPKVPAMNYGKVVFMKKERFQEMPQAI